MEGGMEGRNGGIGGGREGGRLGRHSRRRWAPLRAPPRACRVRSVGEGALTVTRNGNKTEEKLPFGTCVWATGIAMHPLVSWGRVCQPQEKQQQRPLQPRVLLLSVLLALPPCTATHPCPATHTPSATPPHLIHTPMHTHTHVPSACSCRRPPPPRAGARPQGAAAAAAGGCAELADGGGGGRPPAGQRNQRYHLCHGGRRGDAPGQGRHEGGRCAAWVSPCRAVQATPRHGRAGAGGCGRRPALVVSTGVLRRPACIVPACPPCRTSLWRMRPSCLPKPTPTKTTGCRGTRSPAC